MRMFRRRLRGALGMGAAWGLAWFGAGLLLLLVVGPDAADVPFPIGFGVLGFFAGVLFSLVLGLAEGRRSFEEMSLARFAGWGAVGGFLLSGLFGLIVAAAGDTTPLTHLPFLGPLFAAAGGTSAAGALALARRVEVLEIRGRLAGGDDEAGRTGADLP